jgi:hypothetical protein
MKTVRLTLTGNQSQMARDIDNLFEAHRTFFVERCIPTREVLRLVLAWRVDIEHSAAARRILEFTYSFRVDFARRTFSGYTLSVPDDDTPLGDVFRRGESPGFAFLMMICGGSNKERNWKLLVGEIQAVLEAGGVWVQASQRGAMAAVFPEDAPVDRSSFDDVVSIVQLPQVDDLYAVYVKATVPAMYRPGSRASTSVGLELAEHVRVVLPRIAALCTGNTADAQKGSGGGGGGDGGTWLKAAPSQAVTVWQCMFNVVLQTQSGCVAYNNCYNAADYPFLPLRNPRSGKIHIITGRQLFHADAMHTLTATAVVQALGNAAHLESRDVGVAGLEHPVIDQRVRVSVASGGRLVCDRSAVLGAGGGWVSDSVDDGDMFPERDVAGLDADLAAFQQANTVLVAPLWGGTPLSEEIYAADTLKIFAARYHGAFMGAVHEIQLTPRTTLVQAPLYRGVYADPAECLEVHQTFGCHSLSVPTTDMAAIAFMYTHLSVRGKRFSAARISKHGDRVVFDIS